MRKRLVILAVIVFLSLNYAYAAQKKKEQTVQETQISITRELLEKKKAELNGTEWKIELKAMTGKNRSESDVISFTENKVVSKNLEKSGFAATSFTVRMEDDGTLIWETMQSSEKEGLAFWRGDIQDGVMRGVLSRRDKKDNASDFNFVSVNK